MTETTREKSDRVFAPTYSRYPVVFEKGSGCTLWDQEGKAYTDFLAGIAVCNLGHAHPGITQALVAQAKKLWHVSNLYYTAPQTELASLLVANSFADKVFFCNSGAEANEAAIKLVRRYFYDTGETGRNTIIAMEKSFHGRTMAALSATGQDKIKKGFDPVLEGFRFVPFNDIEALEAQLDPSICAVMMEPIQGEGGVRCPSEAYVKKVRQLCDESGALLIFDEIQTGMGRTGKLFAYQHYGVQPDVMTLAKALGNGLPVGAMLARESVARVFGPGSHASTFGGTPLVTAAAAEVVRIMTEEDVVERAAETGIYFREKLEGLRNRHKCIQEIRGSGLLIGVQLNVPCSDIVDRCLEHGFLINCIQESVLRFAPPLVVNREEIDSLISCLDEILKQT